MTVALLYVVDFNPEPGALHRLIDWNKRQHAPDMLRAGALSAANYVNEGNNFFLNIYDIASHDFFSSPAYRAIPERDPAIHEMIALRRNAQTTVYTQSVVGNADGGGPLSLLDAGHLAFCWFDIVPGAEGRLDPWLAKFLWPILMRQGAHRLRHGRRTRDRPGATSDRPEHLLLAEWHEVPCPAVRAPWATLREQFADDVSSMDWTVCDRRNP